MNSRLLAASCGVVLGVALTSVSHAQSLANRINAVRDGRVSFAFAAREGVCGNGRSFISIGSDVHIGSYSTSSDGRTSEPCQRGPVRVVLDRADGSVIDVNTYVGNPGNEVGAGGRGVALPANPGDRRAACLARTRFVAGNGQ